MTKLLLVAILSCFGGSAPDVVPAYGLEAHDGGVLTYALDGGTAVVETRGCLAVGPPISRPDKLSPKGDPVLWDATCWGDGVEVFRGQVTDLVFPHTGVATWTDVEDERSWVATTGCRFERVGS